MNIEIHKKDLSHLLRTVIGVVETRQVIPILSYLLLEIKDHQVQLTATNSEVQISSTLASKISSDDSGKITLPGKKFMDICRVLPEDCSVQLSLKQDRINIHAGKTHFHLSTLPPEDFPLIETFQNASFFEIPTQHFLQLLIRTSFSIAHQGLRYFLNGMFLKIEEGSIIAVSTDAHRLSLNTLPSMNKLPEDTQVIVPRKAVSELIRILSISTEENTSIAITAHHIGVKQTNFSFISNLIQGQYLNYTQLIPHNNLYHIILNTQDFKQVLSRLLPIFSQEKFCGVLLTLENNTMKIKAQNSEKEKAEETLEIDYLHKKRSLAFNIHYLLDILQVIKTTELSLQFSDEENGILIEEVQVQHESQLKSLFIVMPMTV